MNQNDIFVLVTIASICAAVPHNPAFRRAIDNAGQASHSTPDFIPAIPQECANQTYCTIKSHKYPQEYVDNLFRHHLPTFTTVRTSEQSVLQNRFGDPNDATLCQAVSKIEEIYQVKNGDGEWFFTLQSTDDNYKQSLKVETCSSFEGGSDQQSCDAIATFDSGVQPVCKQQYANRQLLAMARDGTSVVITTKIPSCCVCVYKSKPTSSSSNS